jgi:pyruvate/2-oxoglutarate dehydrogenase complex dihydrolipoamide acyltransferase (E2) component
VSSSHIETGTVDVTMPQMGVSVAEGTVVEWKKRPGDWVAADETICEVSTDKIDTEVPSPAAGRVTEILVEVDTTVDVGTVLARIATDARPGEPHASEQVRAPSGQQVAQTGTSEATSALDGPGEPGELAAGAEQPAMGDGSGREAQVEREKGRTANGGGRRYSPVVMRIAGEHGVDLAQVEGTGRGGRVRKQDVLAFIESGGAAGAGTTEPPLHIESPYRPDAPVAKPKPATAPAAAAPAGAYQPPASEPLSRMRKSVGEHMKRSLDTAATCTTWIEVDVSRIEQARTERGLTALPYFAAASIGALREFPSLNAWLEGDQVTRHEAVNLGIAVSLGDDGLIVPVVRDAQDLSVEGIGKRVKALARAARSKQLTPDDVQGGTFTITNPGQFGSIMATPVINQPQVAILDVEAVVKRPVVITDDAGNDSIAIRPMVILGLSWDHRALDGVLAAQFLAAIKRRVEGWDG